MQFGMAGGSETHWKSMNESQIRKLMAMEEENIVRIEEELKQAKARKEVHRRWLSDNAPMECSTCKAGMWNDKEPHLHWSHDRRGKPVYYTATINMRKTA